MPSKVISNKTPYQIMLGKKPYYNHLRVFGCLVYALKKRKEGKFDERGRACIFVSYPTGQKGYKLYDISNKEFLVSRDVVFYENVFPFKNMHKSHNKTPEEQNTMYESHNEEVHFHSLSNDNNMQEIGMHNQENRWQT